MARTRKDPRKDVYTGRSGQMAVLAEILNRGCNAAVPEVDIGEDVLAFRPGAEPVTRLQIKTASAELYKQGRATSPASASRRSN